MVVSGDECGDDGDDDDDDDEDGRPTGNGCMCPLHPSVSAERLVADDTMRWSL